MKTTTLLALAALFVNVAPMSLAQSTTSTSLVSAAPKEASSLEEALAIYDSMPKDCKLTMVVIASGVAGMAKELTLCGQINLTDHPYIKLVGMSAVLDTILTEMDDTLSPELHAALTEVSKNAKSALAEMLKLDIEDEANIPKLQAIYDRFDEDEELCAKYPASYGKIVAASDYMMEIFNAKYQLEAKAIESATEKLTVGQSQEETMVLVFDAMIQILQQAAADIMAGNWHALVTVLIHSPTGDLARNKLNWGIGWTPCMTPLML